MVDGMSILVCGGGTTAHVLATLFASRYDLHGNRYKVTALSLQGDEADRWAKVMDKAGGMECKLVSQKRVIKARPERITSDPSVSSDADIILLTVQSSLQEMYFAKLAPHAKEGAIFAVMPARSGLDLLFQKVMGAKSPQFGLAAFETQPWACRFREFGKSTDLIGTKDTVGIAVVPPAGTPVEKAILKLQVLLGDQPMITQLPSILAMSLANPGQVIHPGITYAQWRNWDGKPLTQKPLFYNGASEITADILIGLSNDIQAVCRKLKRLDPKFDGSPVQPIFEWYKASYSRQCQDTTTLQRAMATNKAYEGLTHPMKGDDHTGYVPDFGFRYLSEDLPMGLCFSKGVAELLQVKTPMIDSVILWGQSKLGKEYMTRDCKMNGRHVAESRAPQAFGVTTTKLLLEFLQIRPLPAYYLPCVTFGSLASAVGKMCTPN